VSIATALSIGSISAYGSPNFNLYVDYDPFNSFAIMDDHQRSQSFGPAAYQTHVYKRACRLIISPRNWQIAIVGFGARNFAAELRQESREYYRGAIHSIRACQFENYQYVVEWVGVDGQNHAMVFTVW
jgi:hypothetical protein